MSWKIDEIIIENFKFFKEKFVLPVKGRNVLIFGENGAGKSSIFWSVYTFMQTAFKEKPEAVKYFTHSHPENLRNRFSHPNDDSSISIAFDNGKGTIHTKLLANNAFFGDCQNARHFVEQSAITSDFLNYKFISKLFDFNNSEENDVFPIFLKEVLPVLTFQEPFVRIGDGSIGSNSSLEWWRYLNDFDSYLKKNVKHPNTYNQSVPEYSKYLSLLEQFDKLFRVELGLIIQQANYLLKSKFHFNVELCYEYTGLKFNERVPDRKKSRTQRLEFPKLILSAKMTDKGVVDNTEIKHPKSFFNEAKITAMGLAMRLAILGRRTPIDEACAVLFIDDMLISLDMSLRKIVVPLILEYTNSWQVFIFTHDRSLFGIYSHEIKRLSQIIKIVNDNKTEGEDDKSAPKWVEYELYALGEENEEPVPFLAESKDLLEKAKDHLKHCRIPECANALRKCYEQCLKALLPPNLLAGSRSGEDGFVNLNAMATKFQKLLGEISHQPNYLIAHFPGIGDDRQLILNPFSHDDMETAFYRDELKQIIKDIEKLRKIKRSEVVKSKDVDREQEFVISHKKVGEPEEIITEEVVFKESLWMWEIDGEKYFSNPRVSLINKVENKSGPREGDLHGVYKKMFKHHSNQSWTTAASLDEVLRRKE